MSGHSNSTENNRDKSSDCRLVTSLLSRLDNAYRDSPRHSFCHAVEGLTVEEATWSPTHNDAAEDAPSIQDIILHVGTTSLVASNRILEDGVMKPENVQAQFRERGANLEAALELAHEGYEKIRSKLAEMTDAQLLTRTDVSVNEEWKSTPEGFFARMIEHHLYHAGQIVYIRSLYQKT